MAWSWLFFGQHWLWAGLVDIGLLLLAILWTIGQFWPRDPVAEALLLPYAIWVGYAMTLNGGIVALNG